MRNKNSSTIVRDAQIRLAAIQASCGSVTLIQWVEYKVALVKAIDADQDNQAWLKEHGLNDVAPSEIFASALDDLRSGKTELYARLTKAQMDEIERERPGQELSEQPYLY